MKYFTTSILSILPKVLPRMREWIEITRYIHKLSIVLLVLPRMREWIEITKSGMRYYSTAVLPRMREWIEIISIIQVPSRSAFSLV